MRFIDFIGLHTSFVLMCILSFWYVASILFKSLLPKLYEKTPTLINAIGIIIYLLFFGVHNFYYPQNDLTYIDASIFFFIIVMLFESLDTTIEQLKKIKVFIWLPSFIFIGLYLYRILNPYMHTYTKFYLSHISMIFATFIILTVFIVCALISAQIAKQSLKNHKKYIK